MLRQVLYARGGLFSKTRGLANFSSFKAYAGLRPAGQPRAFHVFPRLQYDDHSSSYGTTSNSNSSYGTSSKSGTGLGSFKSSFSALGDDKYNSNYTTPSSDSSTTMRHKMGTKDLDLDNPREYEDLHPTILRKLKSISVGLQVLTTKVDTLNKELKDINTKLSAAIAESESTLIRRTLAPLPKKSHWESHRGTKFSAQFWENACLCVIFFYAFDNIYGIDKLLYHLKVRWDEEIAKRQ